MSEGGKPPFVSSADRTGTGLEFLQKMIDNTSLLTPMKLNFAVDADAVTSTKQTNLKFATGTGQWLTNFNGNLKDQYSYTLVSNGETQAYVAPGFQGRGEQDIGVNPFSVSVQIDVDCSAAL